MMRDALGRPACQILFFTYAGTYPDRVLVPFPTCVAFDANGLAWAIDSETGRTINRNLRFPEIYESSDCTGPAFIEASAGPRFPFRGIRDPTLRVRPDTLTATLRPVGSTQIGESYCFADDGRSEMMFPLADAPAYAGPEPNFGFVPPLHPAPN